MGVILFRRSTPNALKKAESKMMMSKMLSRLALPLVFGCLLFGAENAFVGIWKMNLAKSGAMQFSPEGKLISKNEIKDSKTIVTVAGDTITVRGKSTVSGQPISSAFTAPTLGGPLHYIEDPPPTGITDTLKVINDRTDEFISTENGKTVLTTRCEVSANHKTMTITTSGVGANGKAFKTVEVLDRQ